ncbi:hypothetical protein LF845_06110 [Deferribacterales bacterium Es71-Z0220]|uniref:hypothetical protein n=1 Tax=Deferrivibrio essentukiensis TaxID=2880922 RepID=UPI001F609C3F|nr:hypothetical protein [Deferrivibrio essentukiensis]MCB4204531.1 hypothetical protein [Deferrivibrio essentukiensis]
MQSNTNFAKIIHLNFVKEVNKLSKEDVILILSNFKYVVVNIKKDEQLKFINEFFLYIKNKYNKDKDVKTEMKKLFQNVSKDYFFENIIVNTIHSKNISNFFNIVNTFQYFSYGLNMFFITNNLLNNKKQNKDTVQVLKAIAKNYKNTELADEILDELLKIEKEKEIEQAKRPSPAFSRHL